MRSLFSRAVPFLAGAACAVELDKVWDLQRLGEPLAYIILFFVWAALMTFPSRRSA